MPEESIPKPKYCPLGAGYSCKREGCAWWDHQENCCIVMTVGEVLSYIHNRLIDISIKLKGA